MVGFQVAVCLGLSRSSSVCPHPLPLLPTHSPHQGQGQLSDVAAMSDHLPQVLPRRPGQGSETLPFPVPLPTPLLWIEGNKVEIQISPLYNYIFVPMGPLGGVAKPWIPSQNNVFNP